MQFIILGLHFAVAALTPNCGYPTILSISGLAIASMFFSLFIAFYRETYTSKISHLNSSGRKIEEVGRRQSKSVEFTKKLENDNNNNNNNELIDNNNHLSHRKSHNFRTAELKSR